MLPSASGAAIDREERMSAAFQGAIAPTTPTGRRTPIENAPVSEGMISPSGAYASAAACRKRPGTKWIWNIAKPTVQPVSRRSHSTTSSARASRRSAAFRKTRCRSAGGACDHAGKASAAASIARCASSAVAGGHARDDLAGERVEVVEGRAAVGVAPLAADEVLRLADLAGPA